ncbi:M24 family metallopeptidase [Micromonospora sp. NPDC047740]|uniref:M24 family metallopeptidase n=1 Tax=Micromonospora sp. NPDC047740 TaxID=3364254 RepID=UPI00371126BA
MTRAFPAREYDDRLARLQKVLTEQGVDIAIVHTPENLCYLTGHSTPGYYTYQCLLVPAGGPPVLLTRETETVNGRETTYLDRIDGYSDAVDPITATAALVRELCPGANRVALEENSWFLPPRAHRQLLEELNASTVPLDAPLAELRLIKSPLEIGKIRLAARNTNAAMVAAAGAAEAGASERDIAAVAFTALVSNGSEHFGMEPFIASGPRSGTIHSSWTDRRIGRGEPVLLEMAAAHSRYHAPLMHTVWQGQLSGDNQRMAEACLAARDATVAAVRPGNTPAQAHTTCRTTIDSYGLLHTYRKRSGYSVGIAFAPDWGEGHILSLKETEQRPFQPGMVVHVVPTLRIAGVGGIGFSATVLVTDTGNEILTFCQLGPELNQ